MMMAVTISRTVFGESERVVVATGTWTPGFPPELAGAYPRHLFQDIFRTAPDGSNLGGGQPEQDGNFMYILELEKIAGSDPDPECAV